MISAIAAKDAKAWQSAREIAESAPVLGVFAAPEWEELSDDGKQWIFAIVQETQRRAFAPVAVDAELVAEAVAWRCSPGRKPDGSPKAPTRHAIIWQAARLGAIEYAKLTLFDPDPAGCRAVPDISEADVQAVIDEYSGFDIPADLAREIAARLNTPREKGAA